tara:strand:+ start:604 stop:801 length:198 start_codon:yes stop_codon:yes gene_type:complete
MEKKPHAFRDWTIEEPNEIELPGGTKLKIKNKDFCKATKELLEGKEITVLQRKKNNGKTIRPKKT